MKFTFVNSAAALVFLLLFLTACGNNDSTNNNKDSSAKNSNKISGASLENSNSARDDLDELGKIIKLPFAPEEASYWEEVSTKTDGKNQNSAANEKLFVAVLKFSPENAARLVSQIEKIRLPVDAEIDAENRFPAELVAQSQLSGDETLKGKSYAAADFLQTPYRSGKITRIENTDYFVLELTTD